MKRLRWKPIRKALQGNSRRSREFCWRVGLHLAMPGHGLFRPKQLSHPQFSEVQRRMPALAGTAPSTRSAAIFACHGSAPEAIQLADSGDSPNDSIPSRTQRRHCLRLAAAVRFPATAVEGQRRSTSELPLSLGSGGACTTPAAEQSSRAPPSQSADGPCITWPYSRVYILRGVGEN
jgi:hypothetical protein